MGGGQKGLSKQFRRRSDATDNIVSSGLTLLSTYPAVL